MKFSTTILICFLLVICRFRQSSCDAVVSNKTVDEEALGSNNHAQDLGGGGDRVQPLRPSFPKLSSRPPLQQAISLLPASGGYDSDDTIDAMRLADQAGNCTVKAVESNNSNKDITTYCHIPFPAQSNAAEEESASANKVGVVLFPGGLVDPRSYAPIASLLSTRYGIPTVIPVYYNDLAMDFMSSDCGDDRLELAELEFPDVEKWILAGHSMGGLAAYSNMWKAITSDNDTTTPTTPTKAGGLALLASFVTDDAIPACGTDVDFSSTTIPMTSVTGSEDKVLTWENWYEGQKFMSNFTQWTDIYGGTHAQFGSYYEDDSSETKETPLIPPEVQWDFIVASIASVATRMGYPITTTTTTDPNGNSNRTKDDDNDSEMMNIMSSSTSSSGASNINIRKLQPLSLFFIAAAGVVAAATMAAAL